MDLRTLVLVLSLCTWCATLVLMVADALHFQVKGTRCWAMGSLLMAVGLAGLALRGTLPNWVSISLSNTLIVWGHGLFYEGTRSYLGKKPWKMWVLAPGVVVFALLEWMHAVEPSMAGRIMVVSLFSCGFMLAMGVMLLRSGRRARGQGVVGVLCLVHGLMLLVRAALAASRVLPTEFMQLGDVTLLFFFWSIAFILLITCGFIMLVSGRLLEEVQTLQGILPICAKCKKVRDDQGYWNRIESYLSKRSDLQFTHGICPECARELYPELYQSVEEKS